MKWWVFVVVILSISPAFAQSKQITLTIDQAEAQTLLNRLAEGPWKEVNPLMQKLISQVNEQMKPPSPKEAKPNE